VEYDVEQKGSKAPQESTYVHVPSRVHKHLPTPEPRSFCREKAKAALEHMSVSPIIDKKEASLSMSDYTSCVESNMTHELLDTNEVLRFQSVAREHVIEYFEHYTCADFNLPTTSSIRNVLLISEKLVFT
jgi:hypothetical protein